MIIVLAIITGISIGLGVAYIGRRQKQQLAVVAAKRQAKNILAEARHEKNAIEKSIVNEARRKLLEKRRAADEQIDKELSALEPKQEELDNQAEEFGEREQAAQAEHSELDERFDAVKKHRDRARGLFNDADSRREKAIVELSERAGIQVDDVISRLSQEWRESVETYWNQRSRQLDQSAAEPWVERSARRMMTIASSRYQNHFLTERNRSTLRPDENTLELLGSSQNGIREAITEASTIDLLLLDDGNGYRMDGLDGVGREVVRRAFKRLEKKDKARAAALDHPVEWAKGIRAKLEEEIKALGRKAFNVLKIDRPHEDIVELVGALNYRTSYTQNQWLHAVEAAFLAGMMAEELQLDIRTARRATLMHDIGKALTHKIEGSHAVIGADIARKLGEEELVANAIGAHHADEPPNSVYAYLVAAADAMSGARPGARREASDGFNTRVEDLQRIAESHKQVEQAHAVHGGRELRVYVSPRMSDMEVVELSESIAEQVSDEMTFPGQIKVTVIRNFEAIATAI